MNGAKRLSKILLAWKEHGGGITLSLVQKDQINGGLGDEETFAELCFHTLVVRLFAIKWCFDHGYLDDTVLGKNWQKTGIYPNANCFEKILRPKGDSEIEKILDKVFGPTDMYMWINQALNDEIRSGLFRSLQKQKMLTAETDILGEFYQRYLAAYSKGAQFELGQFYTPHNLVRAMWKLTADAVTERGLSLDDENTIIVDPSAGTGTFLTQGFRFAASGAWGEARRVLKGKAIEKYVKKFSGLELNPFSKGVADINFLTEILAHCSQFKSEEIPIPSIFETNSYEIDVIKPIGKSEEDEEIIKWVDRWDLSTNAKKKTKYRIVIGNPPWRNPSPVNNNPVLKKFVVAIMVSVRIIYFSWALPII